MKLWAAKYMWGAPNKAYEIVLYESYKQADECPHDYIMSFTKSQWRKMGCRVPKGEEVMAVELTAKTL